MDVVFRYSFAVYDIKASSSQISLLEEASMFKLVVIYPKQTGIIRSSQEGFWAIVGTSIWSRHGIFVRTRESVRIISIIKVVVGHGYKIGAADPLFPIKFWDEPEGSFVPENGILIFRF